VENSRTGVLTKLDLIAPARPAAQMSSTDEQFCFAKMLLHLEIEAFFSSFGALPAQMRDFFWVTPKRYM
jgi:hypothetical protein